MPTVFSVFATHVGSQLYIRITSEKQNIYNTFEKRHECVTVIAFNFRYISGAMLTSLSVL